MEATRKNPFLLVGIAVAVIVIAFIVFGGDELDASDLTLLPRGSAFVVVIDVDELLSSSLADTAKDVAGKRYDEFVEEMREETGFVPEDVAQVVIGGDFAANQPIVIVAFHDAVDDEALARMRKAVRIEGAASHEVEGYEVWGGDGDRQQIARIRSNVFLITGRGDAARCLRAHEEGEPSRAVEVLLDETGLDHAVAFALDWRAAPDARGGMGGIAPLLFAGLGPVTGHLDVDGDVTASVRVFDDDGNAVVRHTAEVDGDFLEKFVRSLFTLAAPPPRRRNVEPERVEIR